MKQLSVIIISIFLMINIASAAPVVTTGGLVKEMIDFDVLAEQTYPPYKIIQFSSYDRRSTAPYAPGWFANSDGFGGGFEELFGDEPTPAFLKVIQQPDASGVGRYLIAQVNCPGAIVRTWSTKNAMKGIVTVYLDDSEKPLYQGDAQKFLSDKYGTLTKTSPAQGFHQHSACYFPIPFAKSLKIEFKGNLKDIHFYQIEVRLYPGQTAVQTFMLEDLKTFKNEIARTLSVLKNPNQISQGKSADENTIINTKIAPAGEMELLSLKGTKAVQQITLKVKADNVRSALRQLILRGYFDGSASPQIESPLGDFFGSGPGVVPYNSIPMTVTADGTMTCRFLMPFKTSAKFVVENFGSIPAEVTGSVTVKDYQWKPDSSLYFFAKWRVNHGLITSPPFDVPFLVGSGKGKYVGTAVMLYNNASIPIGVGAWWGEGDEKIWIDDDTFPSFFGTGSEDYFNYGWGSPAIFHYAYFAQTLCTGPDGRGFVANNRWHIADPIPFQKHIDFYMELWHHSKSAGFSYARIAYFYATANMRDDNMPITPADVLQGLEYASWTPLAEGGVKNAIFYQAEDIYDHNDQNVKIDNSPAWANGKLLIWSPKADGQTLKLKLNVEKTANYQITAVSALTPQSGCFTATVDDRQFISAIDLYTPYEFLMLRKFSLRPSRKNITIKLTQGPHILTLSAKPKNKNSLGSDIGIDFFWLLPAKSKN